jgi:4-amino-4-deoxy-L-arabinose transferase-like glycosyltransferase
VFSDDKRTKLIVYALIAAGIFVRFYFFFGQVYSDDAYYNYLAYTMYNADFGSDYLGYPVCLVRIGQSFITAVSFLLFGPSENSAAVFPMLFSIMNMLLNYKLAKTLIKSEIVSVLVLAFTAFYPTEVLFASIAFTDLYSTFFINLGILLILIADSSKKLFYAVLGGLSLALSMMFKENAFYTAILLGVLFLFVLVWKRSFNKYILISLGVLGLGMCLEGVVYYLINGDFFYRLSIMKEGALFSRHDFFNEGSAFGFEGGNYLINILKLVFIDNTSAVFLRRTMVFIPLIAVIQLFVYRKNRKNRIAVYWFSGLLLLYLFFTMSLTSYQPMVLRFTWYLYPLFLPAMILAAKLFAEMKKGWMIVSAAGYIIFSLYMTDHFRQYFDMDNIEIFEHSVKAEPNRIIYTDHFTKYSIDLIDKYKRPSRVIRLNCSGGNIIPSGSLVVYHTGHISEIAKQGFNYPKESYYRENGFEEINRFGAFIIFEKK